MAEKLIIAGSRSITDMAFLEKAMALWNAVFSGPGVVIGEVVSGCAKGFDTLGIEWARAHGIPVKRFPVFRDDWRRLGKSAGVLRNQQMAAYATAAVIVWDGSSPGTRNMMELATKHGLKCARWCMEAGYPLCRCRRLLGHAGPCSHMDKLL